MAVGISGHAPVHEVGIKPALDKVGDDTAALFQIQNVGAVHQRINKDDWRAVTRFFVAEVMADGEPVFFINYLGRGDSFSDALSPLPERWQMRPLACQRHSFIEEGSLPLDKRICQGWTITHGLPAFTFAERDFVDPG